ncbi:MAG: DUF3656 domain-containing protein, partial [Acetatifactor sp.]|nr:DUF3656 domain-containing protein [Acetatifactor sp.]
ANPALTDSVPSEDRPLQVTAEGELVSPALKQPITEENVRRQLGKLGDTVFVAENVELYLDENAFYPLKAINDLRRQAVQMLEELLIRENGKKIKTASRSHVENVPEENVCRADGAVPEQSAGGMFHVLLRTESQLDALMELLPDCEKIDRVYLESDLVCQAQSNTQLQRKLGGLPAYHCRPIIALPPIIRSGDEAFLQDLWEIYDQNSELFAGFLVRSMDGLGFLDAMYGNMPGTMTDVRSDATGQGAASPAIYGDAGLYIWNRKSLDSLMRAGGESDLLTVGLDGFCLPYELRAADQHRLLERKRIPCEKVVYGRIPLMVTANCVFNTIDGCSGDRQPEICFLTDRLGKRFPVLKNCRHCMNIIYNSLPLSLHSELSKWRSAVDFRLDFTIEDGQETAEILRYFTNGAHGERPYGEYTAGHEKRGAE